jgi:hypothetical protein
MIYVFLIAVPVLLIISLVFYVLGNFASAFDDGYTPATSNRSYATASPDDDNYDSDAPPVKGDLFQDRSKIADSFAKVQLGLRIMPSQNDE